MTERMLHPAPHTVNMDGGSYPVLAAVPVPGRGPTLPAWHIIWRRGDEDNEWPYVVHTLVATDVEGLPTGTHATQGEYDLTYLEALRALAYRIGHDAAYGRAEGETR